jgi:ubiquinone/menaquinone biosynthesis C-methylase UbiE
MNGNQPFEDYKIRGVNPQRMEAIRRFAGKSILDVGCGSGAYVLELQNEYDIAGVDWVSYPSWKAMPARFSVANASGLTYAENSFDTVLSFETLEHLPDPLTALKTFYQICKNNIIITVPNCSVSSGLKDSNLIFSHWNDRSHVQFFEMETICELVEKAGFKIEANYLINPIKIAPFLNEAFVIPHVFRPFSKRLFNGLQKRSYHITCLVVGKKGG